MKLSPVIVWCFVLETSYKFSLQTMAMLKPRMLVANVDSLYCMIAADFLHYLLAGLVSLYAVAIVQLLGGLRRTAAFCLIMRTCTHLSLAFCEFFHHPAQQDRHDPFPPFTSFILWLVNAIAHAGLIEPFLVLPFIFQLRRKKLDDNEIKNFACFFLSYATFQVATSVIGQTLATVLAASVDISSIASIQLPSGAILLLCLVFHLRFMAVSGDDYVCVNGLENCIASANQTPSSGVLLEPAGSLDGAITRQFRYSHWRKLHWALLVAILTLSKFPRFYSILYLPLQLFYQTLMAIPGFYLVNLELVLPFQLVGLLFCFAIQRILLNEKFVKKLKALQLGVVVCLLVLAPAIAWSADELNLVLTSIFVESTPFLIIFWLTSGLVLFVETGSIWLLLFGFTTSKTTDAKDLPLNKVGELKEPAKTEENSSLAETIFFSDDEKREICRKFVSLSAVTNICLAFCVHGFYLLGNFIETLPLLPAYVLGWLLLASGLLLLPFAMKSK